MELEYGAPTTAGNTRTWDEGLQRQLRQSRQLEHHGHGPGFTRDGAYLKRRLRIVGSQHSLLDEHEIGFDPRVGVRAARVVVSGEDPPDTTRLEIRRQNEIGEIGAGLWTSSVEPLARRPFAPLPQQYNVLSAVIAQVWECPVLTWMTVCGMGILIGSS